MKCLVTRAVNRSYEDAKGVKKTFATLSVVKANPPGVGEGVGVEVGEYQCPPALAESVAKEMQAVGEPLYCDFDMDTQGRGQFVKAVITAGRPICPLSSCVFTAGGIVERQSGPRPVAAEAVANALQPAAPAPVVQRSTVSRPAAAAAS